MLSKKVTFFLTILFIMCISCRTSNTRHYGLYIASSNKIQLYEDSTFVFTKTVHLSRTVTSGFYLLNGDTLILNHTDRNYDSLITQEFNKNEIPLKQALGLPQKLIWKNKRLFINAGERLYHYGKLKK